MKDQSWVDTALLNTAEFQEASKFLEVLIKVGANTNFKDEDGYVALHIAVTKDDLESVKFLIAADADPTAGEFCALMAAVAQEAMKCLKFLIEEAKVNVNHQCKHGATALIFATARNAIGLAEYLIEKGADVHICTFNGKTALNIAHRYRRVILAEILIQRGVDMNRSDAQGVTPLMLAAALGDNDIVKMILNSGAQLNITDEKGCTALTKANADLNLQDKASNTALIRAAQYGHYKTVEILLQGGSNVSLRNEEGETAQMIVEKMGHDECIKVLGEAEKVLRLSRLCRTSIRKHLMQVSNEGLLVTDLVSSRSRNWLRKRPNHMKSLRLYS